MSSVMLFGSCIEGAVLRDKYVCLSFKLKCVFSE